MIKPKTDFNEYEIFELENKLKVLMIKSPNTTEHGACLTINELGKKIKIKCASNNNKKNLKGPFHDPKSN